MYFAINIGPIVKTLGMARKSRELWSASYMFSYLMKCILKALSEIGGLKIVSPAFDKTKCDNPIGFGLYPDRVYLCGPMKKDDISSLVSNVVEECAKRLGISNEFFNVSVRQSSKETIADAIKELNEQLDLSELFNIAKDYESCDEMILHFLKEEETVLFKDAFGDSKFSIPDLKRVATNGGANDHSFKDYICIVQADGDGMGKVIQSITDEDQLNRISGALINFGQEAMGEVKTYSENSIRLYAGGDDLLFIAPVCGNNGRNIFDLINAIDEKYKKVKEIVSFKGSKTSMSYGVSISYFKYPLYEALENARNLLFAKAKHVDGKNAIAWEIRKHSGGAFAAELNKGSDIWASFFNLINESKAKESIVSAVSHKIRNNEGVLKLWVLDKESYESRNAYFFEKYMEPSEAKEYKMAAKDLLNKTMKMLQETNNPEKDPTSTLCRQMYCMLRTAKFVNGEDEHE